MAKTVSFVVGVPLVVTVTGKKVTFEVDLSEVPIFEDEEAVERYTEVQCIEADRVVSAATEKIHNSITHIIHRSTLA